MDEHGGRELHEGDILHLRYSTSDEKYTRQQIIAILGEQDFEETESDVV